MSSRIYVGNLPEDVRTDEVGRLFDRYGRIRALDVKRGRDGRGPAFAFIEFDHPRDAEDAVRGKDGVEWGGGRLRVEFSRGGRVSTASRGPPRHSQYRVRVTGLPNDASWQDLKDHMRQAGDVGFSDVTSGRDGAEGVVEYSNADDFDRALSKLDGSEFKSRFGNRSTIRVAEDRERDRGHTEERRDDRREEARYDDRAGDRRYEEREERRPYDDRRRDDRHEPRDDRRRDDRYDDRDDRRREDDRRYDDRRDEPRYEGGAAAAAAEPPSHH